MINEVCFDMLRSFFEGEEFLVEYMESSPAELRMVSVF